jgi:hypothetical protein
VQVRCDEGVAIHIGPQAVRLRSRGRRRSVGRGAHRPAIEPRKSNIPGADVLIPTEGDMAERDNASVPTARRGRRPWHVRKLFVREPGDLSPIRGACVAGSRREGEEP